MRGAFTTKIVVGVEIISWEHKPTHANASVLYSTRNWRRRNILMRWFQIFKSKGRYGSSAVRFSDRFSYMVPPTWYSACLTQKIDSTSCGTGWCKWLSLHHGYERPNIPVLEYSNFVVMLGHDVSWRQMTKPQPRHATINDSTWIQTLSGVKSPI